MIFSLASFIISILFLYRRKQLNHLGRIENIQLQHEKNLLESQIEIQEKSFKKISQDLHDNISLTLILSKLNLTSIHESVPGQVRERINTSVELITKSINDLNDISKNLNSDLIKQNGLHTSISNEIELIRRISSLEVNFKVCGEPVFMESQRELIIFRVIQEGLNNVLKHSQGQNIALTLNYLGPDLEVTLLDDGIGFRKNNDSKNGSGLMNIKSRIESLSGSFQFCNNEEKGARLSFKIPIAYELS